MMHRPTLRKSSTALFTAACLLAACLGLQCPADDPTAPLEPPVAGGNRVPRVMITDVTTPSGENQAEQGDQIMIYFSGEDNEDTATVRIFASTAANPTAAEELVILDNYRIGPGSGSGVAEWDTSGVEPASYSVFAEIDDGTFDPFTGLGNRPVRATYTSAILVAPEGTTPQNGDPSVNVLYPVSEAGVSNQDVLTVRFATKDPNTDVDSLTITIYFDKDRDAANDDVQPPLEVFTEVIPPGFLAPDVFGEIQVNIPIDLNELPIRRDVDEGGRALPYYVRVRADDGNGGVVDAYANGEVRVLAASAGVVDLLKVGGTAAGVTLQGFDGFADEPSRGGRTGSAFAPLGDLDGDGIDDFGLVSERASPFNRTNVGEFYVVYGRPRAVDPDAPVSQGRYAGYISVNQIGAFANAPENTIFSLRGSQVYHPQVIHPMAGAGSIGITDIVAMPDLTGDGFPEIFIGSPFNDAPGDLEDNDPCDDCTFPEDYAGPLTCWSPIEDQDGGLDQDIDLSPSDGWITDDGWLPIEPTVLSPNQVPEDFPYVDMELEDNERVSDFGMVYGVQFTVTVPLNKWPVSQPYAAGGLAGPFWDQVSMRIEGPDGPLLTPVMAGFTETEMYEIPDSGDPAVEILVATECQFVFICPVGLPASNDDPATDVLPPSAYDGTWFFFLKLPTDLLAPLPGGPDEIPLDRESETTVNVFALATFVEGEEIDAKYSYFDGFPDPHSNLVTNESGLSLLDIGTIAPACFPLSQANVEPNYTYSHEELIYDGHSCNEIRNGYTVGCNGPTNDSVNITNAMAPERHVTGLAIMAASDDLRMTLNEDGEWNGDGVRFPELGNFGQKVYRGARFRGPWYSPSGDFDPNNFFGYTVDVMEDMSDAPLLPDTGYELIVSAPAGGQATAPDPIDLTDDLGDTYVADDETQHEASFDFETTYSRVTSVSVDLEISGDHIARMEVGLGYQDEDTGEWLFIPGTTRQWVFWHGDYTWDGEFNYEEYFVDGGIVNYPGGPAFAGTNRPLSLTLPEAANAYLLSGQGTVIAKIIPPGDCDAIASPTFTITAASVSITALLKDNGYMHVIEGLDYSSSLEPQWCGRDFDGDPESDYDRPMSWPSFICGEDYDGSYGQRPTCSPPIFVTFVGEAPGDAFGWGHPAGDVGGNNGPDDVPDLVCGAPGNDNDPFEPDLNCNPRNEPNPLSNNGKVYLMFGTPSLGGPSPCGEQTFQIRGSHDDDEFGRVQGAAGDMNGDGLDDMFFAAEGYDAVDVDFDGDGTFEVDVPDIGLDAGFVGVLFGNDFVTGELGVRAEQVGTNEYLGVKFIGGTPGARLGGSTPAVTSEFPGSRGQTGVSSAGDFNLDGLDDLLITAPGQEWPAAAIRFTGPVADGNWVRINTVTYEFDTNGLVTSGRVGVPLTSTTPEAAQQALLSALTTTAAEKVDISSISSQTKFPAFVTDAYPTINFVRRTYTSTTDWVSKSGVGIEVGTHFRQGVTYLIFGSDVLLQNNTFVLPNDLNRRIVPGDLTSPRVLKGVVFVSAYEQGTVDEAPIEAVSTIGDIDGDGFTDIMLGCPTADFINKLVPNSQRRQSAGEAYLIYGNEFGLNDQNAP